MLNSSKVFIILTSCLCCALDVHVPTPLIPYMIRTLSTLFLMRVFKNISDESMDVDPNYDPSDFLAMHKQRQSLGEPSSLQGAFTNFLSHEQDDNGPYNPAEASTSAASGADLGMDASMAMQMAPEMPVNTMNNGMGIDDDLDISESDEEDDGSRVRIKKEVFDDGDYALQHQQMGQAASQSQIYMVDSSNEPTTLDYQQPPQLDFQQVQEMEQLQHQVMPPMQSEQLQQQQTPQGDNDYAWTF